MRAIFIALAVTAFVLWLSTPAGARAFITLVNSVLDSLRFAGIL